MSVAETMLVLLAKPIDFVQLVGGTHIPFFSGFLTLTGGSMHQNKTAIAAVEEKPILDDAVNLPDSLCRKQETPSGVTLLPRSCNLPVLERPWPPLTGSRIWKGKRAVPRNGII